MFEYFAVAQTQFVGASKQKINRERKRICATHSTINLLSPIRVIIFGGEIIFYIQLKRLSREILLKHTKFMRTFLPRASPQIPNYSTERLTPSQILFSQTANTNAKD